MLAIIKAIHSWRSYLLRKKFYIQTYHRSLKCLLEQRVVIPEQQKWIAKLLGYDYEILYCLGRENFAAHSQGNQGSPFLHHLFIPQVIIWEDIKQAATTYKYIQTKGRMETDHPEGQLSAIQEVDQQLLTRDALLKQLKANLENSVNCIKQIADRKRRDISFDIDSWVLLKLHPYRQQTSFKWAYQNLASRFYGHYLILEKCSLVAYIFTTVGQRAHLPGVSCFPTETIPQQ
uniref:Reverse transcriptase RNase H-like domain-containing protein n=1 Tax=Populus alba TaxID=43335 RepID=A0A4U5R2P3_POPAL|nr:hypothetical protein D5086_0000024620 [Populus alba]